MMMFKKMLVVFSYAILTTSFVYSQLNLEQLSNFKFGEPFTTSKQKIKSLFTQKPKITKSDFLNAYRIDFENVPFGYYGDADYRFQYVKDSLVSIIIDFSFKAPDTVQFKRLLTTILNDLNIELKSNYKSIATHINTQTAIAFINKNLRLNTKKEDKNYKPINKKYLGDNAWSVYNDTKYTDNILVLYLQLIESHSVEYNNNIRTDYDGGVAILSLEVFDLQFQKIKNQEFNLELKNYNSYIEPTEEIKLKSKNRVYLVPTKLNDVLTMDFVLDLGASDVLISPDVFMILYKSGTIQDSDFIGTETYQFADGSSAKSNVFNIKSIKIGEKEIFNVRASISNSINAPLLLGQSALQKFGSYRIDNIRNLLIID